MDITSDNYSPIIADGNYDVINLKPGRAYNVKLSGTFTTTVITIYLWDSTAEDWVLMDDADAFELDGTAVTEFIIYTVGTKIRFAASATTTAPAIDFSVHQKGQ